MTQWALQNNTNIARIYSDVIRSFCSAEVSQNQKWHRIPNSDVTEPHLTQRDFHPSAMLIHQAVWPQFTMWPTANQPQSYIHINMDILHSVLWTYMPIIPYIPYMPIIIHQTHANNNTPNVQISDSTTVQQQTAVT